MFLFYTIYNARYVFIKKEFWIEVNYQICTF